MANTLAQNVAANQAQAAQVNQMLQQGRSRLPGAAQAPAGITTVPTPQAAPQPMAAPTVAPQQMAAPTAAPQPMAPPPVQDPIFSKYGIKPSDFDKMTPDQQDALFTKIDYAEQYMQEPGTAAMILGERGVDSSKFMKAPTQIAGGRLIPQYDRLALADAYLRSDIGELYGDWAGEAKQGLTTGHGKTITGQESFQDLLDLENYYKEKYVAPIYRGSTGTAGTNPYTDKDTRMTFSPSNIKYLAGASKGGLMRQGYAIGSP